MLNVAFERRACLNLGPSWTETEYYKVYRGDVLLGFNKSHLRQRRDHHGRDTVDRGVCLEVMQIPYVSSRAQGRAFTRSSETLRSRTPTKSPIKN